MKRILLDTNAFNNKLFLTWIARNAEAKTLIPFINSITREEKGRGYDVFSTGMEGDPHRI